MKQIRWAVLVLLLTPIQGCTSGHEETGTVILNVIVIPLLFISALWLVIEARD